jgi:hypothetical protein
MSSRLLPLVVVGAFAVVLLFARGGPASSAAGGRISFETPAVADPIHG